MQVTLTRRFRRARRRNGPRCRRPLLGALLSAGVAITALGATGDVLAQSRSEETKIQFQYSYYKDWQQGGEDRMDVHAPQILLTTPVGDASELEAGFVYDSVSGASPMYHDTL